MTLRRLENRIVTVINTTAGTEDIYGDEPRGEDKRVEGVSCRRSQRGTSEDVVDRDQEIRQFLYYFDADVTITARDRIEDEGMTLEVKGEPVRAERRRKIHHVEVLAERVDG